MKSSILPYMIAGVLCLCALLAVFFLLVLPGLCAESPARPDISSGGSAISPAEAEGLLTLTHALVDAESSTLAHSNSIGRA